MLLNSNDIQDFFEQVKTARRLLVCDLGYLGDTIHLIPALYCIRQALPHTQLHVITADHVKDILNITPWVDKTMGYQRFEKRLSWSQEITYMQNLWATQYDAVINLNSSDRSVRLSFSTNAPLRLNRVPNTKNYKGLWKYLSTHTVYEPFDQAPIFEQRWNCLKKAGFPGKSPEFAITIPPNIENEISLLLKKAIGNTPFFHISPFTTEDGREIPPPILTNLIERLRQTFPNYAWVISCAPTDREKTKLQSFLSLLQHPPELILPGTLSVIHLTALIQKCALHLGGDSGSLHLARITNRPAVSWFYPYKGLIQWMPKGPHYRSLMGEKTPNGLLGIHTDDLYTQITHLLTS